MISHTCCTGVDLAERMERGCSVERGYSSRSEENIHSSVTKTMMRVREYGIGDCNVPTNGKYTF